MILIGAVIMREGGETTVQKVYTIATMYADPPGAIRGARSDRMK